jgi:hypothetical protein
LKLGGARGRIDELKNGTAYQLATYAHLLAQDGVPPAVAYFLIRDGRLVTDRAGALAHAELVRGPSASEAWRYVAAAAQRRFAELESGLLLAPGNPGPDGKVWPAESAVDPNGWLVLTPGCRFCDKSALCGRMFAAVEL